MYMQDDEQRRATNGRPYGVGRCVFCNVVTTRKPERRQRGARCHPTVCIVTPYHSTGGLPHHLSALVRNGGGGRPARCDIGGRNKGGSRPSPTDCGMGNPSLSYISYPVSYIFLNYQLSAINYPLRKSGGLLYPFGLRCDVSAEGLASL